MTNKQRALRYQGLLEKTNDIFGLTGFSLSTNSCLEAFTAAYSYYKVVAKSVISLVPCWKDVNSRATNISDYTESLFSIYALFRIALILLCRSHPLFLGRDVIWACALCSCHLPRGVMCHMSHVSCAKSGQRVHSGCHRLS